LCKQSQLFTSCLVSCVNSINTQHYASGFIQLTRHDTNNCSSTICI